MNPFHTTCATVAQQVGKTAFQLANCFDVLLTMHLSIIFVINQLNAHILVL